MIEVGGAPLNRGGSARMSAVVLQVGVAVVGVVVLLLLIDRKSVV